MKAKSRRQVLLVTLFAVLISTGLLMTRSGISQQEQPAVAKSDLPLVEFVNTDNPARIQKARKHRKSLRQDRSITELPAGVDPLPIAAHMLIRLPVLPVAQSSAVIIGDITDRNAILTDDKQGVYSDFSIHVAKIFKDDQDLLTVGGLIEASRPGGAVRFPSGKIQRYTIDRLGYPQLGKLYVLFLKRDEDGDFSIITGYDLSGPGVTPLDGDARQPSGDLQFGIYRGKARDSFLIELQDALTKTERGGD